MNEECTPGTSDAHASGDHCPEWVIRELVVNKDLRFTELMTVMSIYGWEFTICQLVVDDNPRVNLRGLPVNEYGRPRLDKREISAVWEYRSGAWEVGAYSTGSQAIGGGLFMQATPADLVAMVTNAPAKWAHTDH
ncbi:hypothetical protein ACIA8C_26965 [Nocardia sp. NPDC051321]|uniref:hypothetical protein n=1 Tax=Nocardia sp. NPDC051321 TaxID=3364323 RepID=UPI0037A86C41